MHTLKDTNRKRRESLLQKYYYQYEAFHYLPMFHFLYATLKCNIKTMFEYIRVRVVILFLLS